MGGIGKSALMLQYLNMAQSEGVHSIWLDGRVCMETPAGFLESLNAYLVHHPLVRASQNKSIQDIIAEMASRKLLLYIDNYEYIHQKEGWLREAFLLGLSASGLLVVLACRQDLSFYWHNDLAWQNRIRHIRLDPLTRGEARHYFTQALPISITGHWAEKEIVKLSEMGAVNGYPDGTFRPNHIITRAEFISIVVRALGLEQKGQKVFSDTEHHWAKDAIATAYELGITHGYNATTFGASEPITRQQMVAIIARAFELKSGDGIIFVDHADISSWAVDAIQRASNIGIITGYPDGTLRPNNYATRVEAVRGIVRTLEVQL